MYKLTLNKKIVCSLSFLLTMFFCQSSDALDNITLTLGEQQTIEVMNVKRIAVGDPSIADVKALEKSNKVLITARGVGRTNLIIWDMDDREQSILIEVIAKDPKEVASNIRSLLDGIEGIQVITLDNRVVVNGSVLLKADLDKINKVVALYPQATNLATINATVLNVITNQINNEFEKAGMKNVQAKRLVDKVVIQGDVPDEETKKRAEEIASAFGAPIVNFIDVGVSLKKMILVNVDFIEVNKNSMDKLGIQWSDPGTGVLASAEASADVEGGFGRDRAPFSGNYGFGYNAVIKAVKGDTNSRILAQPKLLCRSGEKAEFMAGGEVAIPLITQDTSKVEYKPFGILLNISPVIDKADNIATEIKIEKSTPMPGGEGAAPSFQKSMVKTFINVKSGQTIVLSGLVKQENFKGVSKLPGLGDLPILGELFKSRSFNDEDSELVVFVTPEVMNSNDQKNTDIIDGMKKKYENSEDKVKFNLMD